MYKIGVSDGKRASDIFWKRWQVKNIQKFEKIT
jgi:hypothetical protein